MVKTARGVRTSKGGLKSKILIPVIIIILLSMLTVGISGYFIQKNNTYDLLATMTSSELNNFEDKVVTERQNAQKARESVNNNLIRLAKSIASQFKYIPDEDMNETLTALTQELDIDRINIGDESGITIFSSDNDGLGFDFNQYPDSAEYLKAIDDKSFTAVGENVETPEGTLMHFIGAARQDAPQFIQIGIMSSTIDGIVTDTNMKSLAAEEEFADGGYVLVANSEGEILSHKNEGLIGTNLSEYDWGKKILKQKDGKFNYKVEGQDEYMSFKSNENNIIAASVTSGTYLKDIKNFGNLTLIIEIIVLVLTTIFLSIFLNKIIINKLQDGLLSIEEIEKGNLNTEIDTSGNDEVSRLMLGLNNMKTSLSDILGEISSYVEDISKMSHSLSDSSEQTTFSGQQIAASVTEIATGANDQVRDVHESRDKLENLSDRIEEISRGSQTIEEKSTEIEGQTRRSVDSVLLLRDKFTANEKSTQAVNEKTLNLAEKSSQIENIIEVINDIAAQTNLLALNASIEAARAGEHGKGFAVVAEEIRKLAEESVGASGQIEEIINSIEKDINETRISMQDVSSIVTQANEELENTVEEFNGLKISNDVIVDLISELQVLIDNSNKDKDEAILSMDNVAAVSEETAASTEEISASTEQQASTFERISNSAGELNKISKGLLDLVSRFDI